MDGRTAEALVMDVACDIVAVLRLKSRTCLVVAYRPRLRTCVKKCLVQLEMGSISRLQLSCCGLGKCLLGCGRRRFRVEAVSIRQRHCCDRAPNPVTLLGKIRGPTSRFLLEGGTVLKVPKASRVPENDQFLSNAVEGVATRRQRRPATPMRPFNVTRSRYHYLPRALSQHNIFMSHRCYKICQHALHSSICRRIRRGSANRERKSRVYLIPELESPPDTPC